MSTDIAVGLANRVPNGSVILNKPSYIICLEKNIGKTKTLEYFLTIDKPEVIDSMVHAKGLFVDLSEDQIIENYSTVLTSSKKELLLEMMFPQHRIHSIRSLAFRAK